MRLWSVRSLASRCVRVRVAGEALATGRPNGARRIAIGLSRECAAWWDGDEDEDEDAVGPTSASTSASMGDERDLKGKGREMVELGTSLTVGTATVFESCCCRVGGRRENGESRRKVLQVK
jgi:hypothetical protein